MNVHIYLENLLQGAGEYALTEQDLEILDKKGLQDFLLAKLFSKKFRKWSIDDRCRKIVENEINESLDENRPIKLFFAQGSYKLWRVSSAPRANWAEFFNLAYIISYLAPLAAAYAKGVQLTYYMLTVLPQTHNNLSEVEVGAYLESFKELVGLFKKYLPANFEIKVEKDLDKHTISEYEDKLKKAFDLAHTKFYQWPKEKQDDYMRRARLNIKWNGVEDWSKLNETEKDEKVEKAVLYEYAATQDILERDKERRGVILSTLARDDSIGIGSTSTSIAKHWVGEGVLEEDNRLFYPRILSPSQYEYAQSIKHITESVNLIPGEIFSNIEIYPKHFAFSQK
jgi:hypothetical protein